MQRFQRGTVSERCTNRISSELKETIGTRGPIDVRDVPLKSSRQFLKSFHCVLQVRLLPNDTGVGPALGNCKIGIVAIIVSGQTIVETHFFYDDLQGYVFGPFQAEKARHKILGAFQHPILSGCSGNDLLVGIIEMTIVIVV